MAFQTQMTIHFDESDPAGIAFSGLLFTKVHRCFEEFVVALGENPKQFFLNPEVIFPLRHVEAEYFRPLLPFEKYQVEMSVIKLSESSFRLLSEIKKDSQVYCLTRSTHVCCLKSTMEKTSIPAHLKQSLKTFLNPE